MKKIVALVLAMVMVLGLATTAFAATPAYVAEADDLATPYAFSTDTNLKTCAFKLEEQVQEIGVTQTFAKYVVWATNKETKAPAIVGEYTLAVSADSADFAFVDGTKITYLNSVETTWTKGLVVSKVPTVDFADAEKCGEVFSTNDEAVYVDAAGDMYIETIAGSLNGYVDGKLVKLEKAAVAYPKAGDLPYLNPVGYDVFVVAHTYGYDAKAVNGTTVVTDVFCKVCKAEFTFIQGYESQAIAKFGAGNYIYTGIDTGSKSVFVAKAGVSAGAGTTTETVESAKTFDAGIAMYVGMSVMAAAGSAVVLKKKKD